MKRLLLFVFLMCGMTLHAQPRFDAVQRHNPWNAGSNASGLRADSISLSYADLGLEVGNGGFVDYSSSDQSLKLQARTESIRHFKRLSFAGHFSYTYFDAENMSGSMFLNPNYYPVDILEFTPGRKIRETYDLGGVVAADFNARWTGGLRIDFKAENYAKRKDLRHQNRALDLKVMPSVSYHVGQWRLGASYLYMKNSERVSAKEVGTSAESYQAFFDKGLLFGVLERWDGNGTHLDETGSGISGFPVSEQGHGAGIQCQYAGLYAELMGIRRTGKTGEKGFHWHQFQATDYVVRMAYAINSRHTLRLEMKFTDGENEENILKKETVNGISQPVYYGSNPIFQYRNNTLRLSYELDLPQKFNLQAAFDWTGDEQQSTLYYPYVKRQTMDVFRAELMTMVVCRAWEVSMGGFFQKGRSQERDFEQESDLETTAYPQQLTDYFRYRNEYRTASRLGLCMGVRRHIRAFYIDLTARYEHGFRLRYVAQPNHLQTILTLGYNF